MREINPENQFPNTLKQKSKDENGDYSISSIARHKQILNNDLPWLSGMTTELPKMQQIVQTN